MPRERLTLEALVSGGTFNPGNHRHRRALDESGPLDNETLEAARQLALDLRGRGGAKQMAARRLQEFAALVEQRR